MRADVAAFLRASVPGARIVHELPCGPCRADIAVVGRDRLLLVELKSERDVLKRAERQIETFSALGHGAILVAHIRFFDRKPYDNGAPRCASTEELDACKGSLWVYPQPPDGASYGEGGLYAWRLPKPDLRQPRAFDFLQLLWRVEMVEEAERHGIETGRRDMVSIAASMAWRMTGQEIAEAVCRQLRMRAFPEADQPLFENGDARVTARSAGSDLYRQPELNNGGGA